MQRILKRTQRSLIKWMRLLRKGWNTARTLERFGFTATVLAIVVASVEINISSYHVLGGYSLLYPLLPWVCISVGFAAFSASLLIYNGRQTEQLEQKELQLQAALLSINELHNALSNLRLELDQRHEHALTIHHEDRLRRRLAFAQAAHSISHITRDFIIALFNSEPDGAHVCGTLVEYCNAISQALRELYDCQFRFRVAIKAYSSNNQLLTVGRDRDTCRARDPLKDEQPVRVETNTAFQHLQFEENTVFASDDLPALKHLYNNTSPKWNDQYTATMVVPIRRSGLEGGLHFELVGFLAVDCLSDGHQRIFCDPATGLADEALRNFLLATADVAFAILKRGKIVDATLLPQKKHYILDPNNFAFIKQVHRAFVEKRWVDVTACLHEPCPASSGGGSI